MGKLGVKIIFLFTVMMVTMSTAVEKYNMILFSWEEGRNSLVNQERGFYIQIDTRYPYLIEYNYSSDMNPHITLLCLDLNGAENMPKVPQDRLDELSYALAECRRVGMSAVVRVGYHFWGDSKYVDPESFDTVLAQATQIAEVLNGYEDVVMAMQAGFIGPYGEWHSSNYMEKNEDGIPWRVQLLSVLLNTLSEDIPINVRRPMFIREAEEYGLDISRLGIHNDALLSTDSDMGTYAEEGYDREAELLWQEENIEVQVNGGELTNISEYTDISNAVKEFRQMKITYLNGYHNADVLSEWKKQTYDGWNGYEYIKEHLGYRFFIESARLLEAWYGDHDMKISVRMENAGFAWPANDVPIEVILCTKDGQEVVTGIESIKEDNAYIINAVLSKERMIELTESFSIGLRVGEAGSIQLANDELKVADGVTFFAEYIYDEEKGAYVVK